MPVTDDAVAALRAQLTGAQGDHKQLFAQVSTEGNTMGYAALVAAAFTEAADRRFRAHGTTADIIRFVADVRAKSPDLAEKIDPKTGEQLFLSALMDSPLDDLDGGTIVGTQLLLLAALTADEGPTPDRLDAYLAEARTLADEWMAATPPRE